MTDILLVPWSGRRITDANDDPLASAQLYFYDAGTANARTVYSDIALSVAHAQPVVCDSGGLAPLIYTGTSNYKMVVKDSDGTTISTHDDLPGAVDHSSYLTSAVQATTPVISKTTTYSVLAADLGKVINADCSGGAFTITMLSAVTAGDGSRMTIRHVGTANTVTIAPAGAQTINGEASHVLHRQFEAVSLVSDGANWHVDGHAKPFMDGGATFLSIVDRDLNTPPGSPAPGARYIAGTSPTAGWSSYSYGDVLEADGLGGWIQYSPQDGWQAWLVDENRLAYFDGTAWNIPIGRGHLFGCITSVNSSDTAHDIDVSVGEAASDDTTPVLIRLTSATTKRFDATFAAGSAAGGFAAGESLPTSGTIHMWLIAKDDGTTDVFANNHATTGLSPTLPSGYTYKRRIASVRTDGSANIIGYRQVGDKFSLKTPILDISTTIGLTSALHALSVPAGLNTTAYMNIVIDVSGSQGLVYLSCPDDSDIAASTTVAPLGQLSEQVSTATTAATQIFVDTNTSSQVRAVSTLSSTSFLGATLGWAESRGRFA